MLGREPHDPAAAAKFATALLLGGVRTLPYAAAPSVTSGTA
jgi:hypothetical protein